MLLEEYENKVAKSVNELDARDNRIKELEVDLNRLTKELESLQLMKHELERKCDGEEQSKEIVKENKNSSMLEGLVTELEDKRREVERLDGELRKRTSNLQELVNKELWDKNREIEKLQYQLNSISVRRELEIMALQQQVASRDFQLKMLQDKVAELGIQVNIPTSLMLRELRQMPVTFNQHVHFQQPSVSSGDTSRTETGDIPTGELGRATLSSTISGPKDEVSCLRDQLQASVEERKYLSHKVEELRERLRNTPERDNDSRTLRSECARLREELDKANVWRKEVGEACSLLTKRLEELARFLSSLLRHPEQLCGLRAAHRQLLKQAVENSMELSRSLSVSLSINNQDLTNSSFPPLMDSFSSLLMSAGDANFSLAELLKDNDVDEGEINSFDPAQQENVKSSGTSPYETTLTPNSQGCRSSGSNSEIAQMCMMKDSVMSEDNALRDKIVDEQAQVIAQLRSQVETLTHEIKQRDIEFSRSQKDELNMYTKAEAATMFSGPRSEHCSSSKHSSASSGAVWRSRTETERFVDVEETKESLSSMTFYNSHHLNGNIGKQWSSESQNLLPNVKNSVSDETKALLEEVSVSCQEKNTEVAIRSMSSPVENTNDGEEAGQQGVAVDVRRSVPNKQDHSNNKSLPVNYKMNRSSSASAVALSHLQQSIHHHDVAAGSLSDSEAWSEPDRNVSLARIGLNEESAKAVQSPGAGVAGCTAISSARPRNPRTIQEDTDTSGSSEETAHEISRIQGTNTSIILRFFYNILTK
jgi:phage host-nuclease inhibitor protein Gam